MAEYIVVHGIRVAKSWEPETFGRLTSIGPAFRLGDVTHQVCECGCSTTKVFRKSNLLRLCTASCGCLSVKHGKHKEPEYNAWIHMIHRCTNTKDKSYPDYGGRGIRVCDRWLGEQGFQNFLEDMGPRPEGMSIDRIDNEGHYCPENCRWATAKEQARNRRTSKILTLGKDSHTVAEWAEILGVNPCSIASRVSYGWSDERILTQPYRPWSKGKPKTP